MPSSNPEAEQRAARARELRKTIGDRSRGVKPSKPTPREITDEAAQRAKEEAERENSPSPRMPRR